MDKLVIFGDANLLSTKILLQEILSIIRRRDDICLAGVIDTARSDPKGKVKRIIQFLVVNLAKKIFNPHEKFMTKNMSTVNLYDICRKANIEAFIPKDRNVNSQEFVHFLRDTVRPTIALSVGCLQIFKKPLIDVFEVFVNYHDGLLPKYRGLSCTSFSRYFDDKYTGFTYHLVNEAIDEGNILIQDGIQVSKSMPLSELTYRKTIRARAHLEQLIELMIKRSSGTVQKGESLYFGKKSIEALTTINCPSEVTFEEIQKRLRIFGALRFNINGRYYSITRFKRIDGGRKRRSKTLFVTYDDIVIRPIRISWLPLHVYKIYETIQRLLRR